MCEWIHDMEVGKVVAFLNKTHEELNIRTILINLTSLKLRISVPWRHQNEGENSNQSGKISTYLSDKVLVYDIYKKFQDLNKIKDRNKGRAKYLNRHFIKAVILIINKLIPKVLHFISNHWNKN